MELLRDDVLPDRVDGLHVGAVARERRDVRHAAVEVGRAHGVADGLPLRRHGTVVLVVRAGRAHLPAIHERAALREHLVAWMPVGGLRLSALVEEVLGLAEVLLVAGGAVELAERELDLLVPGNVLELGRLRAEGPADEVGVLDRHVEERPLAGHPVVGGGGLVHVADVVELVSVRGVAPARRAHHVVHRLAVLVAVVEVQRARGVEVAVRLLRLGDLGDEVVEVLLELRVGVRGNRVRRALDDLVNIRVVEGNALETASRTLAGQLEVADAAGLLALLEIDLHRHDAVRLEARMPEPGADGDVRHLGGVERVVARMGAERGGRRRACDQSVHLLSLALLAGRPSSSGTGLTPMSARRIDIMREMPFSCWLTP